MRRRSASGSRKTPRPDCSRSSLEGTWIVSNVTDLRRALEELRAGEGDGPELAEYLQEHIEGFDMDAILQALDEVRQV